MILSIIIVIFYISPSCLCLLARPFISYYYDELKIECKERRLTDGHFTLNEFMVIFFILSIIPGINLMICIDLMEEFELW